MVSSFQEEKLSDNTIVVTSREAGQKLLQLLERRLLLPQSLLHRWIRTGQIRCNSARCKPFERIGEGTVIRLPPAAKKMAQQAAFSKKDVSLPLPPTRGEHNGLVAYSKPAGLPTHAGTDQKDCLAVRLHKAHEGESFLPTPCHRLDKDTSGLILVAESYAALRSANQMIVQGEMQKEYLCWVHGKWPHKEAFVLKHFLAKQRSNGFEKMTVVEKNQGKLALSFVYPVVCGQEKSLLLVRIHTGRKHQIRVQMAYTGHPILGDHKYGMQDSCHSLLLHAARIILPDGYVFEDLPPWPSPYAVTELPLPSHHHALIEGEHRV